MAIYTYYDRPDWMDSKDWGNLPQTMGSDKRFVRTYNTDTFTLTGGGMPSTTTGGTAAATTTGGAASALAKGRKKTQTTYSGYGALASVVRSTLLGR